MTFTQKRIAVNFGGEEKEILKKAYRIIDELYTYMDKGSFYYLTEPDSTTWTRDDEILVFRTLLENIINSDVSDEWELA